MKADDLKIVTEKQRKAREMLLEVEQTNKMSLTLKEQKKQKEIEEDEAIYRYNHEKQQAEYERQILEKRIKEEKEKELQKMREL